MRTTILYFAIAISLFISCTTPSMVTIYKNRDYHTGTIHAVLVAGVVAAEDTLIRSRLEHYFAAELTRAGYNAVPSLTAFGEKGLADLGQEETMRRLCGYGFDAVLTIALVDGSKEKYGNPPTTSTYAASYYLERIWNYERIEADVSATSKETNRFWECILFDLYSLRPLGAVQIRLYDIHKTGTVDAGLANRIIAKMIKEKII